MLKISLLAIFISEFLPRYWVNIPFSWDEVRKKRLVCPDKIGLA